MRICGLLILNFCVYLQLGCEQQQFNAAHQIPVSTIVPSTYTGQVTDSCSQSDRSDGAVRTDASINLAGHSTISLYVKPFYDSNGPQVDVGIYSNDLESATPDSIISLVAQIEKEWSTISIELMYVASIRLFDLGMKDAAVYWFYSAQYRARLFASVVKADSDHSIGHATTERLQAHNAFYELAGPIINRYAFSNPAMLQEKIQIVKSAAEQIPRFKSIYPTQEFIADRLWPDANNAIAKGLGDFLSYVENNAQEIEETLKDGGAIAEKKLFSLGAKANARYLNGQTPLHVAINEGDKESYSQLLAKGVSPNVCNYAGASAVHLAAQQPDGFWLSKALEHGGNPNRPNIGNRFSPNETPIFYAIDKKQVENVLLLVAAGADVNHANDNHETPLFRCMGVGLYALMIKLLDAGANPTPPEPALTVFENGWFKKGYEKVLDVESDRRDYFALRMKLVDMGHLKADGKE